MFQKAILVWTVEGGTTWGRSAVAKRDFLFHFIRAFLFYIYCIISNIAEQTLTILIQEDLYARRIALGFAGKNDECFSNHE